MKLGGTDTCPQTGWPSALIYFGQVSVCAAQEAFSLKKTPRPLVLRTPTIVRKSRLGGYVNCERLSVPPGSI